MKKTVTQETFDAAVQENIEEFGMEALEAVESAIKEFELQGVDLVGIIKTAEGGNVESHPLARAVETLKSAVAATSPDHQALRDAAEAAQNLVPSSSEKEELDEYLNVGSKAGIIPALLDAADVAPDDAAHVAAILTALEGFLGSDSTREDFWRAKGASRLCRETPALDSGAAVEAIARVAAAAATKHEGSKCAFVDEGFGPLATRALTAGSLLDSAVIAICLALRSFTTADDERPAASKAFQNGRTLAKEGVLTGLLSVFQGSPSPAVAAALCSAAKRLAVNDEICKDFADAGGLQAALSALQGGMGNPGLVKSTCSLLRQLANSDELKQAIVTAGGLELLNRAVGTHTASPLVLEQALGLLVALTLRNPSAAEKAVEVGCVDSVVDVMSQIDTNAKDPRQAQWVQRQACMSIRNIVVRNNELRPAVLGKGVEPLLRQAKTRYPAACQDVGSAALRDLGLENYND